MVADIGNDLAEPLFIVGQFTGRHIFTDKVAEYPAEIFMTRVGEEASRIGKHTNEAAQ